MKKHYLIPTAMMMTLAMSTTALAGVWRTGLGLNENRWWYDDGNGDYAESEWRWLDGNGDKVAECYAFDGEGWMYANTTTPDGYQVNQDGAWVVNGIVQTRNLTVDLNRHHEVETREQHVDNNGADIYGVLHIPSDRSGTMPLVIMSHGLGGTADSMTEYADALSKMRVAVYRYDFRGGGENSRSEGATTEMSPLTEVTDLEAVIEAAKTWDFVDWDNVFLMGNSQGGLVSALTAPKYQEDIKAEILFYPAFVARDNARNMYTSLDEVPESEWFNWLTLGKKYYEDVWDLDAYAQADSFAGDVLLVHGDADVVVPVSYSERLAGELANVEYHVIPGAGHGFHGEDFDTAVAYIKAFLEREIQ